MLVVSYPANVRAVAQSVRHHSGDVRGWRSCVHCVRHGWAAAVERCADEGELWDGRRGKGEDPFEKRQGMKMAEEGGSWVWEIFLCFRYFIRILYTCGDLLPFRGSKSTGIILRNPVNELHVCLTTDSNININIMDTNWYSFVKLVMNIMPLETRLCNF